MSKDVEIRCPVCDNKVSCSSPYYVKFDHGQVIYADSAEHSKLFYEQPKEYLGKKALDLAGCTGSTTMYQYFSLNPTTCIVFLVPAWKLDHSWKRILACFGIVAMGVVHAFLGQLRRYFDNNYTYKSKLSIKSTIDVSSKEYQSSLKQITNTISIIGTSRYRPIAYIFLSSTIYTTALVWGYLLMLLAMTYDLLLFICVIAGVVTGQLLIAELEGHNFFYFLRQKKKDRLGLDIKRKSVVLLRDEPCCPN